MIQPMFCGDTLLKRPQKIPIDQLLYVDTKTYMVGRHSHQGRSHEHVEFSRSSRSDP